MDQETLIDVTDNTLKSDVASEKISIEIAYAKPQKQIILKLDVDSTISPRDAIRLSSIKKEFPEIDLNTVKMGVFGKQISETYQLKEKDRIELYRPLLADPKEVRRRLAAQGKTMGKKKSLIK